MSGLYFEVEHKPRPLVDPLPSARHGEWLAHHDEPAQKFADYLNAHSIRKSDKFYTIYLCVVGDFTEPKQRIFELTQDYLFIFFDCTVKVQGKSALASIHAQARRIHCSLGDSPDEDEGLQVEPVSYLAKLKALCQQNGLAPESSWYKHTTSALAN
jgi:hypothetical protein